MNDDCIRLVLSRISYPGFTFVLMPNIGHGPPYLQIECDGRCNTTGAPMAWKSRKWTLSRHMTVSEIVQTAFKAVLTAVEHEAREQFTYRGAAIFGPHFSVDRLVALAQDPNAQDVRP